MISFINLAVLFAAKVADNALSTTKTILVQRSRWILAGIAVIISDFIYFWITKRVVSANNEIASRAEEFFKPSSVRKSSVISLLISAERMNGICPP